MPLLFVENNLMFLTESRNIIIVNLLDFSHKSISLPDVVLVNEKKEEIQQPEDIECEELLESYEILDIIKSPNEQLIAISTKYKEIFLYTLNGNDLQMKTMKRVPRIANGFTFSPDSGILLVCDKSGDCYSIDMYDLESKPKWILGHLSMLLDIIFTPDGKFVITCDRDEKIRVTQYPKTHIIENYCLGHTEFVSSIAILPHCDQLLLSLSGDLKAKLWKYIDGDETFDIELPSPGYKLFARKIDESSSIVAILFYNFQQIRFYKISDKIEFLHEYCFSEHIASGTFAGNNNEQFYVHLIDESEQSSIVKLSSLIYSAQSRDEQLSVIIKDNVKSVKNILSTELDLMFKKKFDNLKDYQERKKRRIETKT